MVWNKQAECMSKEEKEKLQLERLQQTVKLAYNNVSFYKEKFDEAGITPEDIKTLKDIEKIPFTTKDDLRASLSIWFICCSLRRNCRNSYILRNKRKTNSYRIYQRRFGYLVRVYCTWSWNGRC